MDVVKLDVTQVVTDARGREYEQEGGSAQVRDLIHMAMGDDPPTQPGVAPQQAPADEKRRRWRIATLVMANDVVELPRGDADYIVERAAVMLMTPAFGFLDSVVSTAIGESASKMPAEPADQGSPPDEEG